MTDFYDTFPQTPQAAATAGDPSGLGAVQAVSGLDDLYTSIGMQSAQTKQSRELGFSDNGFVAGKKVVQSMSGVGQTDLAPAAVTMIALTAIAIRGTAGYFAGKAMAPNRAKEKTYALWGIPVTIFFGALGLGVQGAVALSKRK